MGHLIDLLIGLVIIGTTVYGTGYVFSSLIKTNKNKKTVISVAILILILHYIMVYELFCLSEPKYPTDILANLIIWEFGILMVSFSASLLTHIEGVSREELSDAISSIYFTLLVISILFIMALCVRKLIFT